jgi:hypothetical protein
MLSQKNVRADQPIVISSELIFIERCFAPLIADEIGNILRQDQLEGICTNWPARRAVVSRKLGNDFLEVPQF